MNINLSSDNDIQTIDAELPFTTGIEEIRQLTGQVLRSVKGDWFLNLDLGLPYYQTIFRKSTTLSAIEGVYLHAIADIPGILELLEFSMSFEPTTREIDITFRALTTDGVLNFKLLED